jgi:hypothetical protein
MAAILWRVLIAAICVVLIFLLIPPFAQVIGFTISAPLMTIIKICVAGLALLYVLRGPAPPWPNP